VRGVRVRIALAESKPAVVSNLVAGARLWRCLLRIPR
jgi:hypothetical protein